ncbi:MAG: hypothetical protein M1818_002134 [Claussenomyces sp. TS43310]|nr:MAG: hypothetical protein M1818_002134 [Claussenomyces sp. TS43310]
MSLVTVEMKAPTNFLSLAPTLSASFPQRRGKASTTDAMIPTVHHRSSSAGSTASTSSTLRFLRLGPVHWGEDDGQGVDTTAEMEAPTTFLSLAPTLSASFPPRRASIAPKASATDVIVPAVHHRSSSAGSTASTSSTLRFLRLAPVHWGEDDGQGDWSEVVVNDA